MALLSRIIFRLALVFVITSLPNPIFGSNLDSLIIKKETASYIQVKPFKRKVMTFNNKSLIFRINPFNYAAAGALFVYQRMLSEQIQANCTYVRSCSSNMKWAIEKKGFLLGVFSGLNQYCGCFPNAVYDYPDYKITSLRKVDNVSE